MNIIARVIIRYYTFLRGCKFSISNSFLRSRCIKKKKKNYTFQFASVRKYLYFSSVHKLCNLSKRSMSIKSSRSINTITGSLLITLFSYTLKMECIFGKTRTILSPRFWINIIWINDNARLNLYLQNLFEFHFYIEFNSVLNLNQNLLLLHYWYIFEVHIGF